MRHQLKISLLFALTLVLSGGALSGCTKREAPTKVGNRMQILHYGNGAEPQDLDTHTVTGVPESHIIMALFEGLVNYDPKDLHPVPGVAESWTISPDAKTYTFKLRTTAKWSNGDPVTAHDFVYSWNRLLSPGLASEYAYMLYPIAGAEDFNGGKIKDFSQVGVKALGDYTLEVKLRASTPYFLGLIQHSSALPVHRATIEKFGGMNLKGSKWTRPENMVSNGPFVLKRWDMNKVIVVTKNPTYWDAANVKLSEVDFYPTESSTVEEKMFRSDELHVTNTVPITKIEVYKKEHPELIRLDPYLGHYYYRINVTKKPFDDARVRRAFGMTIDRVAMVEKVTKGGQLPSYAHTPPGTAGYTPRAKVEYDPEKARKLLAEAGYPGGKGMPPVEILYNTLEEHKTIAEALQQMWKKELGVDVTITNQDWKVYITSTRDLRYSLSRAGWIGDYNDPNTFLDMFVTGGGNNQTGWSNKKYDALIAEAARTQNQKARFEVFQKAEQILIDEMPLLPIYVYTRSYLIRPEVKGWYENLIDIHPFQSVYLQVDGAKVGAAGTGS